MGKYEPKQTESEEFPSSFGPKKTNEEQISIQTSSVNVLHGKICSFSYGFKTSSYKHLIVCISVWSQCLWLATRQRQINNLDFRINHIVQDSEVFPQHVINHPNSTRHCVDWLLIRTDRVTGDYSAPSRAAVCPLSISVRKRQKRWEKNPCQCLFKG